MRPVLADINFLLKRSSSSRVPDCKKKTLTMNIELVSMSRLYLLRHMGRRACTTWTGPWIFITSPHKYHQQGGSKIWLAIFHSFMLQQAGKGESPIVFLLHE